MRADGSPPTVVERDRDRFATLAPEARAEIPEGYEAPLDMRVARTAVRSRRDEGIGA